MEMRTKLLNSLPVNTSTMNHPEFAPAANDCWQAWFDGSALPNPGRIGIGAVVLSPDGRRFEKSAPLALHGCNNQAELQALCAALELAHVAGARRLRICGDSDVAIRYVTGPDSTKIAALSALVMQARAWLARFDEVQLRWVPRHRNVAADHLCRQALGLADKATPAPNRRRRR